MDFGKYGLLSSTTVRALHTTIKPEEVLLLPKCGGLKKRNKLGDLILPIAAIRGDGTSNDYLPPEVPALPAFSLQETISTMGVVTSRNGFVVFTKLCRICDKVSLTWFSRRIQA